MAKYTGMDFPSCYQRGRRKDPTRQSTRRRHSSQINVLYVKEARRRMVQQTHPLKVAGSIYAGPQTSHASEI